MYERAGILVLLIWEYVYYFVLPAPVHVDRSFCNDRNFVRRIEKAVKAAEKRRKTKMETKKSMKKVIIGVGTLVAVLAILLVIFNVFREKPVKGSKSITLKVLNEEKQTSEYQVQTDAEFLRQAMEEAEGFTFDGEMEEYGYTLYTINGETHNWNVDGSYWAVFVNDEYGKYGIDSQPVEDGDVFRFEYTPPYSGE